MFNNERINNMFGKKKEQKKDVWLVIEQIDYSDISQSFYVAKSANSLDDAIAFKVSLDQLNDRDAKSYFIVTKTETATNEVIKFHNQKVANENK